jgi:uracil phosphoribosyltransferase
MSVYIVGGQPSIASQFLNEIRDKEIQMNRMRFRRNMERMGEIMAYEISKKLVYTECIVNSPLASLAGSQLKTQPVIVTVLRAGLVYFQGFLNYFDQADSGFIGAYRKEEGGEDIKINLEYFAAPNMEGREVILVDPMLATGKSFVRSVSALATHGRPSHLHIASLIASPEGIRYVQENLNVPHTIWTFAVDEKLDSQFYIVPGLGDAGDLSFGDKM